MCVKNNMRINIRDFDTNDILETICTTEKNVSKICETITISPEYGGVEIDYYFEICEEKDIWTSLPSCLTKSGYVVKQLDDKQKSLRVLAKTETRGGLI